MTAPPVGWHDVCTDAQPPNQPDPDAHLHDLKDQGASLVALHTMTTINPPPEYL